MICRVYAKRMVGNTGSDIERSERKICVRRWGGDLGDEEKKGGD